MIFLSEFKKQQNIFHGIMEKKEGVVNPFADSESGKNILKSVSKLKVGNFKREDIVYAEQVHGKKVFEVPENISGVIKLGVDGLVTSAKRVILAIKTADCAPLFLYHPEEEKIGILHAGRKSVVRGIIKEALSCFSSPKNLLVGIGPHIRKESYFLRREKSGEVVPFKSKNQMKETESFKNYLKAPVVNFLEEKEAKVFFDLSGLILEKLKRGGVKKENIEDCRINTFSDSRFYSARKRTKQNIDCFGNFIGLK